MLLIILMERKLLEHFTKKNTKKNQNKFRIEQLVKKKDNKLYNKWKGYNNLFNNWINKKDINE